MSSKQINVTLTPNDYEAVRAYAENENRTLASVVREAVREHLRREGYHVSKRASKFGQLPHRDVTPDFENLI